MNWRLPLGVMLAVVLVSGCDKIQQASAQAKAPKTSDAAAQKVASTPADDSQTSSDDSQHNAVLEGEDQESKERRNKARASLGLGDK